MLSCPTPGAIAYTNAHFGRGSGGIFMDNVGCRGTESTLLSCSHSGVGVHNCDHSADAGVSCFGNCRLILLTWEWYFLMFCSILVTSSKYFAALTNCTEGQIRLRGGQKQGTVQICLSRVWGTICDNSWDSRDATVVCRQLGYPVLGEKYIIQIWIVVFGYIHAGCLPVNAWLYLLHSTGAIPLTNAYYGSGTGAILIDYVSCTGNEQFLANCTNNGIGVTSSSCGHDDDAGVQCPGINLHNVPLFCEQ